MKIAILADLHLGYNVDAEPQAKQALEKASQIADIVIAAGDLFDVRIPKQEVVNSGIKLFKNHLEAMQNKEIVLPQQHITLTKNGKKCENAVIAIPGTHERRTKGLVNVVELLDSAGTLINCHRDHVIVEKNGEKVAILGMAGVPEEYAKDVVKAGGFAPLDGHFNVFVFHQTLKEVIPMNDVFMSCADLPPGFDLYINGHIHWRRELKAHDKTLLIPGSTVITQMRKNEMEKKGVWLYDTVTQKYEFIYIDSRPFFYNELNFENATAEQVKNAVEKAVAQISEEGRPLIKLKLRGSLAAGTNTSTIDATLLARQFSNVELYLDKEFDVIQSLKDKIELIRRLKSEEKSVAEIGIAVLKEKLKKNKSTLKHEEELFSLLSEGEIEKAVAMVKNS